MTVIINRGRRRSVFRPNTDRLYVYSGERVFVVRAWPPIAWRRTNNGWKQVAVNIRIPQGNLGEMIAEAQGAENDGQQLLLPFMVLPGQSRRHAWLCLFATIPPETRAITSSFGEGHWGVLNLLHGGGAAAADLARANPALAFALASSGSFRGEPAAKAVSTLVTQRGKAILEWLGFPPTESARRLLGKIPPQAVSVSRLLAIREALADPKAVKAMVHVQGALNGGVIDICTDPALQPLVSPSFLQEIAECPEEDVWSGQYHRLVEVFSMGRCLDKVQRLRPFVCRSELLETHEAFFLEIDGLWGSPGRGRNEQQLPSPPVEGCRHIRPIMTYAELCDEARRQKNCVRGRFHHVIHGREYYYRVMLDERATLSLVRATGKGWVFGDLLGKNNKPVSPRTWGYVKRWLSRRKMPVVRAPARTR